MGSSSRLDTDRLIEKYRSYAHAIAAEVARKLPSSLEKSDLQAAAELGLVEAAAAFDPSRGALFQTFAYYRIRGAVYDHLRKTGWLSRRLYAQYRFETAANQYMQDYADVPQEKAGPQRELEEIRGVTASITACYLLSIDGADEPADTAQKSAEEALIEAETRQKVRQAVQQLPQRNRQVIEDYYFHGMNLEEIGKKMGLSKSRVSRIHSKSVEMVREVLRRVLAPARREAFGSR
jgi:RNA polymerase sigma factor for flagellar operon FliA